MDIFSEIELDFGEDETAPALIPSQPIGKPDPIREKFYDMRSMASDNPNTWNDAKLFYRQAKFMEYFEDDYTGVREFSMYSPCYQQLGYEELRTYFTWRTSVRRGKMARASLSSVFLYIYELLANIGVGSPVEGLDKLMWVWNTYGKTLTALDDYLPHWLKHYHIYYLLPHSFSEFIEKYKLHHYYKQLFMFVPERFDLQDWLELSTYDITKSKFYKADNQQLIHDCFRRVLYDLDAMCGNRHEIFKGSYLGEFKTKSLVDLFSYRYTTHRWHMFRRANFYHWYRQPNKKVEMPDGEVFTCANDNWMVESRTPYNFCKDLIGYIIKRMEVRLREETGYKIKLSANKGVLFKATDTLMHKGITYFDVLGVINMAVSAFYKDATRVVVEVSSQNLSKIRDEAQETQERLIVEDEMPHHSVVETQSIVHVVEDASPTVSASPWETFKQTLTEIELQALTALLTNHTTIEAFAHQHGIMPEVLADSINEKAMDAIGDSVLDEALAIYDDYVTELTEMIK